jgi:hypothetical protein
MKAIASKLVKIMQECSYVQKRGRNAFHNYNYALASDVLDKVGESCVKHGVATVANAEILEWKPVDKQGRDGAKTEFYATVRVCITAIDQDSGESVTFSGVGCGQDVGDKAVMKAETAAIKYAWMTTLNIATGDDPEADETVDKRNAESVTPPPAQATKPEAAPICENCGKALPRARVTISQRNNDGKILCTGCGK